MKIDLYETVTNQIIEALEAGHKPWQRPWGQVPGAELAKRSTGQDYRGINQLILGLVAGAKGYQSPYWFTFKQAKDLGGCVRKGEKSTQIVFYKKLTVKDRDSSNEDATKQIPMLRGYRVFNADQVDDLPAKFHPAPVALVAKHERNGPAEAALRSSGATIKEGGAQAFYSPSHDFVQMPPFAAFENCGGYLATLAHELTHWTGHKSRCDRFTGKGQKFGCKDYAFEELVAEMGAAFTCARLGVAGDHIESHAAYIGSWLKKLREDKRAIFKAAALAQTASDMVLANVELEDVDAEPDECATCKASIETRCGPCDECGHIDENDSESEEPADQAPAQGRLFG